MFSCIIQVIDNNICIKDAAVTLIVRKQKTCLLQFIIGISMRYNFKMFVCLKNVSCEQCILSINVDFHTALLAYENMRLVTDNLP